MRSRVYSTQGSPAIEINSNTLLAWLADFEDGVLLNDDAVTLIQYMIDNRLIWIAPEWMQRFALMLIAGGYCIDYDEKTDTLHGAVCMCLLPINPYTSRGGGCP